MAAELVKLRLPNGQVIERPRKIAKLFIRGGAEEILPVLKPREVGTKTSPKTPPPIVLKEPEITKPEDYPTEIKPEVILETVQEVKETETKELAKPEVKTELKPPAKKKSTSKKKK